MSALEQKQDNRKWAALVRFMNLSLFLGAVVVISIGAGYWLGRQLDEQLNQNYVFTILFLLVGCGIAFYVILRRLMEIGKGKDTRR
jgi:F0F1-type ATP synthase assembly protein I